MKILLCVECGFLDDLETVRFGGVAQPQLDGSVKIALGDPMYSTMREPPYVCQRCGEEMNVLDVTEEEFEEMDSEDRGPHEFYPFNDPRSEYYNPDNPHNGSK